MSGKAKKSKGSRIKEEQGAGPAQTSVTKLPYSKGVDHQDIYVDTVVVQSTLDSVVLHLGTVDRRPESTQPQGKPSVVDRVTVHLTPRTALSLSLILANHLKKNEAILNQPVDFSAISIDQKEVKALEEDVEDD